jgi:hypothetical protein
MRKETRPPRHMRICTGDICEPAGRSKKGRRTTHAEEEDMESAQGVVDIRSEVCEAGSSSRSTHSLQGGAQKSGDMSLQDLVEGLEEKRAASRIVALGKLRKALGDSYDPSFISSRYSFASIRVAHVDHAQKNLGYLQVTRGLVTYICVISRSSLVAYMSQR